MPIDIPAWGWDVESAADLAYTFKNSELCDRNVEIVRRRWQARAPCSVIAKEFGLSSGRVNEITTRAARVSSWLRGWRERGVDKRQEGGS